MFFIAFVKDVFTCSYDNKDDVLSRSRHDFQESPPFIDVVVVVTDVVVVVVDAVPRATIFTSARLELNKLTTENSTSSTSPALTSSAAFFSPGLPITLERFAIPPSRSCLRNVLYIRRLAGAQMVCRRERMYLRGRGSFCG